MRWPFQNIALGRRRTGKEGERVPFLGRGPGLPQPSCVSSVLGSLGQHHSLLLLAAAWELPGTLALCASDQWGQGVTGCGSLEEDPPSVRGWQHIGGAAARLALLGIRAGGYGAVVSGEGEAVTVTLSWRAGIHLGLRCPLSLPLSSWGNCGGFLGGACEIWWWLGPV